MTDEDERGRKKKASKKMFVRRTRFQRFLNFDLLERYSSFSAFCATIAKKLA